MIVNLRNSSAISKALLQKFLMTSFVPFGPVDSLLMYRRSLPGTDGNLESTAQLADKICEVTTPPTTASISPAAPDNMPEILGRIEELSRQLAALQAEHSRARSMPRERNRSQSRDRRRDNAGSHAQPHNVCWYHTKFGNGARKCTPPCSHQRSSDSHNESNQPADSRQENSNSRR